MFYKIARDSKIFYFSVITLLYAEKPARLDNGGKLKVLEHLPHTPPDLTKNQAMVMMALSKASGPLSAYSILDQLRPKGIRAPLQVYRALDKLVDYGMVHKLASMNAFVACQHPDHEHEHESMIAFTICESCGEVTEIANHKFDLQLHKLAGNAKFNLKRSMVELFGKCEACT